MNDSKRLGDYGERIACCYLEKKGYKILDKNYSRKWQGGPQKGEVDIIARPRRNISGIFSGDFESIQVVISGVNSLKISSLKSNVIACNKRLLVLIVMFDVFII